MTGLQRLREDLGRPALTVSDALWLLRTVEGTQRLSAAAWFCYAPCCRSYSPAEIARQQDCTRGPVVKRLKTWRERALLLLRQRDFEQAEREPQEPAHRATTGASLLRSVA